MRDEGKTHKERNIRNEKDHIYSRYRGKLISLLERIKKEEAMDALKKPLVEPRTPPKRMAEWGNGLTYLL